MWSLRRLVRGGSDTARVCQSAFSLDVEQLIEPTFQVLVITFAQQSARRARKENSTLAMTTMKAMTKEMGNFGAPQAKRRK